MPVFGELVKKMFLIFQIGHFELLRRLQLLNTYYIKGFNGWCAGTSHPLGSLIHIYKMKTGVFVIH